MILDLLSTLQNLLRINDRVNELNCSCTSDEKRLLYEILPIKTHFVSQRFYKLIAKSRI